MENCISMFSTVLFFLLGNFVLCNAFAPYGYGGVTYEEFNPMEESLQTSMYQQNFTYWIAQHTNLSQTELSSIPVSNLSEIFMRSDFASLDLALKDYTMSILLSNVGHACVGIDLKKSEISAMFITPEVNLTGNYVTNGSLLNGSIPFQSTGNWNASLSMTCTLKSNFYYVNGSHITLNTHGVAGKYQSYFKCGKDDYYDAYGRTQIESRCDSLTNTHNNNVMNQRFDGLWDKLETSDENKKHSKGIERYIERWISKGIQRLSDTQEVIKDKLGMFMFKYLTNILEQKSVFEMMDFNANRG